MQKTKKKRFKRIKWLFHNLTFFQFVKYLFKKKPVYVYDESKDDAAQERFPIDTGVSVGELGTLLIKPSGIHKAELVIRELKKYDVRILKAVEISDYSLYSDSVFTTAPERERRIWVKILDAYFPEHSNTGILLYLDKDIETIAKIKNLIRKKIGISFYKVIDGDQKWTSGITPIHSSNVKERVAEESVIQSMMECKKAFIRNDLMDEEGMSLNPC